MKYCITKQCSRPQLCVIALLPGMQSRHTGPGDRKNESHNTADMSVAQMFTSFRDPLHLVVGDASASRAPVGDKSPQCPVFTDFVGASYLKRCVILCQKLAREQLYSSAAVIATPRTAVADGAYVELSPMTGPRSFVASFAGHIAAKAEVFCVA